MPKKPPRNPIPTKPRQTQAAATTSDDPHDADRWIHGKKMATHKLTINLDVDLYKALKHASVNRGKSMTVILIELLRVEFESDLPEKK